MCLPALHVHQARLVLFYSGLYYLSFQKCCCFWPSFSLIMTSMWGEIAPSGANTTPFFAVSLIAHMFADDGEGGHCKAFAKCFERWKLRGIPILCALLRQSSERMQAALLVCIRARTSQALSHFFLLFFLRCLSAPCFFLRVQICHAFRAKLQEVRQKPAESSHFDALDIWLEVLWVHKCGSKITQLHIPGVVSERVVEVDIPVSDIVFMKVSARIADCHSNLKSKLGF
mmetsp:Transcript_2309/g.3299  ORF Transcript_2309/g.3299 Transcript_2309/m.3299 type:complete len:229 (-) Transcript_2309:1179-1865(-)